LLAFNWDATDPVDNSTRSIWLPTSPVTASPAPLYGMWDSLTPAACWKASAEKCGALPLPPVPYVSLSGFALADAISHPRSLYFDSEFTSTSTGVYAVTAIGTTGMSPSHGSFLNTNGNNANVLSSASRL